jgi:hypothetical protein
MMTSTRGATLSREGKENSGTSELPHRVPDTRRPPHRLWLAPEVARHLGRYLSPIVATLRAVFDDRRQNQGDDETDRLTIDMSDASTVPGAQLVFLITLLRQAFGNGVEITLSGVKPTALGALVDFEIPRDVVVIDSRGRRWAA